MVKIVKQPIRPPSADSQAGQQRPTRPLGETTTSTLQGVQTEAFRNADGGLALPARTESLQSEVRLAFAKEVIVALRVEATQPAGSQNLIDPLATLQTYYPTLKVASSLVAAGDPVISGGARAFTSNIAIKHPPDLARLIERAGGMEHTAVREPSAPAGLAVYTPETWAANKSKLPDELALNDETVGQYVENEYGNKLIQDLWSYASGSAVLRQQWQPWLRNFIRAEELKPGTVNVRFRSLFGNDMRWPVDDETAALLRRAAGVFKIDESMIPYAGKTLAQYKVSPENERPRLKPLRTSARPAIEPSWPALEGVPYVQQVASANWVAIYEGKPVPHPESLAVDDAGVIKTTYWVGGNGETITILRDHHLGPRGALAPDWAGSLRNATRAQELTGQVDIDAHLFSAATWPATGEAAALLRRAAKAFGVSEHTIAFNGSRLDLYTGRPVPKASDLMTPERVAELVKLPPAQRPAMLATHRRELNLELGMRAPLPETQAFREALEAARERKHLSAAEQRKLFESLQPEPHLGVAMALSGLLATGPAPLRELLSHGFSPQQVEEAVTRAASLSMLVPAMKRFLTDGLLSGREDFHLFAAREILAQAPRLAPKVIEAAIRAGEDFDPTLTLKAIVDRALLGTEADRAAMRATLKQLLHEGFDVTAAVAGRVEMVFPQAQAEVLAALEALSRADLLTREAAMHALRTSVHAYAPMFEGGGSGLLERSLGQMFDEGLRGRFDLAAADAAEPGAIQSRAWEDRRSVGHRLKLEQPSSEPRLSASEARAAYPTVAHQLGVLKASLESQAAAASFDLEHAALTRAQKVLDLANVEPRAREAFLTDISAWAEQVKLELLA